MTYNNEELPEELEELPKEVVKELLKEYEEIKKLEQALEVQTGYETDKLMQAAEERQQEMDRLIEQHMDVSTAEGRRILDQIIGEVGTVTADLFSETEAEIKKAGEEHQQSTEEAQTLVEERLRQILTEIRSQTRSQGDKASQEIGLLQGIIANLILPLTRTVDYLIDQLYQLVAPTIIDSITDFTVMLWDKLADALFAKGEEE